MPAARKPCPKEPGLREALGRGRSDRPCRTFSCTLYFYYVLCRYVSAVPWLPHAVVVPPRLEWWVVLVVCSAASRRGRAGQGKLAMVDVEGPLAPFRSG